MNKQTLEQNKIAIDVISIFQVFFVYIVNVYMYICKYFENITW